MIYITGYKALILFFLIMMKKVKINTAVLTIIFIIEFIENIFIFSVPSNTTCTWKKKLFIKKIKIIDDISAINIL